jgi:hypothetical protein
MSASWKHWRPSLMAFPMGMTRISDVARITNAIGVGSKAAAQWLLGKAVEPGL